MAYEIALIPGDGIGREVIPEGVRVLETLAKRFSFDLNFTEFSFSCAYYREHGRMMPEDGIACFDSTITNLRDIGRTLGALLLPLAIL